MTDLRDIQALFANGEQGGYWPADPAYAYEDSAGTIPASRDGVVGLLTNAVTGYPNAIQATTANKPYLRRTPVSNKTWLDSNTETGALTATFSSSLGSACTIATVGAEGVTITENQTVGTTYNLTSTYGYNSDILIINRALTAAEMALVKRVMRRNVPTLGCELVTNGGFEVNVDGWSGLGKSFENGAIKVIDSYSSYNERAWQKVSIGSTNRQYILSGSGRNNSCVDYAQIQLCYGSFVPNTFVASIDFLSSVIMTRKVCAGLVSGTDLWVNILVDITLTNTKYAYFDDISVKEIL